MITIPSTKYTGLADKHYVNIRKYIITATKFYLKCCYTVNGHLAKKGIDFSDVQKLNASSKRSLHVSISIENLKYNDINASHLFNMQYMKKEFIENVKYFSRLFEQMLNNTSKISIKKIIKANPMGFEEMQNYVYSIFEFSNLHSGKKKIKENKLLKAILSSIFNYSKFSDNGINGWNAYEFCRNLGVNVCPYCNRIYTHTVTKKDENIIRAHLDHFIPKSRYPLFGLSFFNLIPSCSYCNSSIKGDDKGFTFEEMVFDNFIHPYFDIEHFKFRFKPFDISGFSGDEKGIEIEIIDLSSAKMEKTLKFFRACDIYQVHKDLVAKLINKRIIYNDSNLEMISNITGIEKEILFNSLFDKINDDEIIDYSLGKLKNDVIEQLKKLTI
ncbi:HNH endonuclease [Bacillus toyonensis]